MSKEQIKLITKKRSRITPGLHTQRLNTQVINSTKAEEQNELIEMEDDRT